MLQMLPASEPAAHKHQLGTSKHRANSDFVTVAVSSLRTAGPLLSWLDDRMGAKRSDVLLLHSKWD